MLPTSLQRTSTYSPLVIMDYIVDLRVLHQIVTKVRILSVDV